MLWIRAGGRHRRATIGWRGADRQQRLFAAAVAQHLSVRVASRWALPPSASVHVRGLAVDAGPASGAGWPDRHDMRSGLCRRYADESWHVERLAAALGSRCPAMQAHA